MKRLGRVGVALVLGACGFACAHDPPGPLLTARAAYQHAATDPVIREEAPVPLYEAQQALARANRAFERDAEREEVEHLAYLAERRVEIARELARRSAAHEEAEQLGEARSEVLVDARTREAELAREQAARAEQQALLAEHEATRLAAELEALAARQTERGLVLTLEDTFFDADGVALTPPAQAHLLRLAEFLLQNPDRSIAIEAHTNGFGSPAYNLALSQRRAESIRGFLVQQGIAPGRLATRAYGAHPLTPDDTPPGRLPNRRVEIIVLAPARPG